MTTYSIMVAIQNLKNNTSTIYLTFRLISDRHFFLVECTDCNNEEKKITFFV